MSSAEFYCDLIPTRPCRRLPLLCGCLALLAGAALIVRMPLHGFARLLLCLIWLAYCLNEIRNCSRTAASLRLLRLYADGAVSGRFADGEWQQLRMLSGSMVLRRVAWLRLRLPDGLDYGELLSGNARDSRQWHRLQLIWRQNRRAFGRPT